MLDRVNELLTVTVPFSLADVDFPAIKGVFKQLRRLGVSFIGSVELLTGGLEGAHQREFLLDLS